MFSMKFLRKKEERKNFPRRKSGLLRGGRLRTLRAKKEEPSARARGRHARNGGHRDVGEPDDEDLLHAASLNPVCLGRRPLAGFFLVEKSLGRLVAEPAPAKGCAGDCGESRPAAGVGAGGRRIHETDARRQWKPFDSRDCYPS